MSNITKEYELTGPGYTHYYEIFYKWRSVRNYYEIRVPVHPTDPWGYDAQTHHLYESGLLCIDDGKEPRDFEFAEAVAYYWMERFSRYVMTGKFTDDGARVVTPD